VPSKIGGILGRSVEGRGGGAAAAGVDHDGVPFDDVLVPDDTQPLLDIVMEEEAAVVGEWR
jgi:hypothetical protein